MELLPTQVNEIYEVIDATPFERRRFIVDPSDNPPNILLIESPYRLFVDGNGPLQVRMTPGSDKHLETSSATLKWVDVLQHIAKWLGYISRELEAVARRTEVGDMPDWVAAEMPPDYAVALREIERFKEVDRQLRRMGGLLWVNGDPLNAIVRDAFHDFGLPAELTPRGATYDVTVTMPKGRLLIEVTGIDGGINKGSRKIAQVLDTRLREWREGDQVALAVNAYRQDPPKDREKHELVTKDALPILIDLKTVIFTTMDLFALWKIARTDQASAKARAERLMGAPPGIVRL